MVRIDVHFTGEQLPLAEVVRLSQEAERGGLGGVWHAEAFRDSLVPLAAVACATERVRIGTDVVQWTRTLPTLELAAADLQELSGGRFTLGIGTSAKDWNVNWHGISYERPLRRMREYVEGLRVLWTGSVQEPVSYEGEVFQVRDYTRFNGPLENPPRIHIGATQTGMARLAGEIADGVNFNAVASADYIRDVMRPTVEEGAAKAGRSPGDLELGVLCITSVDEDRAAAVRRARHQIGFYSGIATYFEPVMRHHGFGAEYEAIRERFHGGDPFAAFDVVTDEMVEALTLSGTADEVRAGLARFEGVVDFVMIYAPSFLLPPQEILSSHERMIAAFSG